MAKNKKKRKKQSSNNVFNKHGQIKPKNFIRKYARKLPLSKCYIAKNWQEIGMATTIVSRKMPSGDFAYANYLVDTKCLGVKDTWGNIFLSRSEFEETIEMIAANLEGGLVECDPILAQNVVYGAVEYAEDLGFDPHKDFQYTEFMLDDVEELEYMELEFGQEGKPFYFEGPHDNVEKIMATLLKNVGEGNFEYVLNASRRFSEF